MATHDGASSDPDQAQWNEEDSEYVVFLTSEGNAPDSKPTKLTPAPKPARTVPSLPASREQELAQQTPNENLMMAAKPRPISLAEDYANYVCWIALENRVGTLRDGPWFDTRPCWVPFLADMRARFLTFVAEIHMGCWPGWSYHTTHRIIFETEEDKAKERPDLVWSFAQLTRIASPLFGAKTGPLRGSDWVFSGDRLTLKMRRVYVPAWLQHSAKLYASFSYLWKYVPNPNQEPRQAERDLKRKRDLLPFPRGHPRLAQAIQFVHDSFAHAIFPARMSTKPLYELSFARDQPVLGEIPGMRQRLWVHASQDDSLHLLGRKRLEQCLWLGTRPTQDPKVPPRRGPRFDENALDTLDFVAPHTNEAVLETVRQTQLCLMGVPRQRESFYRPLSSSHVEVALWPCSDDDVPKMIRALEDLQDLDHSQPSTSVECVCHGYQALDMHSHSMVLVVLCRTSTFEAARRSMQYTFDALLARKGHLVPLLLHLAHAIDPGHCVAVGLLRRGAKSVWLTTGTAALVPANDSALTSAESGLDLLPASTDSLKRNLPYQADQLVPGERLFLDQFPSDSAHLNRALSLAASPRCADKSSRMIAELGMAQAHRACADDLFVTRALVNRMLGLDLYSSRRSAPWRLVVFDPLHHMLLCNAPKGALLSKETGPQGNGCLTGHGTRSFANTAYDLAMSALLTLAGDKTALDLTSKQKQFPLALVSSALPVHETIGL